jgi:hypothetical protein
MITFVDWHGYPNAAGIVCDQCGKTIAEGTHIENAIDRLPAESVTIERKIRPLMSQRLDFCDSVCEAEYKSGLYYDPATGQRTPQ